MEETGSGARVVRWPTLTFQNLPKAHGLPNMVFGLDLQTRQLPLLQDSWSALTFRSPNMEVLGVCPAQLFSNQSKSLQTPGDIMENSITPCFHSVWQGTTAAMFWSTFQVQIIIFKWVISPGWYQGQWSWQLAPTTWPISKSLDLFLYIDV